jgi:hypothetical protein
MSPKATVVVSHAVALASATAECPACAFGPRMFARAVGAPVVDASMFPGDPTGDYVIDIDDGGSQGSDGSVSLNGELLLAPRRGADAGPRHVRRAVLLRESNRLEVRLTGKAGSTLTVSVLGGTKAVGPAGGSITVPGGDVKLMVPAGALATTAEISIVPSANADVPPGLDGITPLGRAWSFEPNGLTFAKAADLTIRYASLLGQVASANELGLVHVDDALGSLHVLTAADDPSKSTLFTQLPSFSRVTVVRRISAYALMPMRWGIRDINVSRAGIEGRVGAQLDTWQAETGGIRFVTVGGRRNILVESVPVGSRLDCPQGWAWEEDQTGVTCLPSKTRVLGADDQVQIFLSSNAFSDQFGKDGERETAIRHHLGHALGIADAWLSPSWVFFNPKVQPELFPVMNDINFYCECVYAIKFIREGLHPDDIAAIRAKYGPPPPPAPALIAPIVGAQIAQNDQGSGCSLAPTALRAGYGYRINFRWASVPGATLYRIVAQHAGSIFPIADVAQSSTQFSLLGCGGFVVDANLTSWSWQVQAFASGLWGPFSAPRDFSFQPCRLPDASPCDAGPGQYPGPIRILNLALGANTLTIGGSIRYTATVENLSGAAVPSAFVQTFVTQNGSDFAAGFCQILCGQPGTGTLPTGTSTTSFTISTGIAPNLVTPGPATVRLELRASSLINAVTLPIAVAQSIPIAGVTIADVALASSTLQIGGGGVGYTALVTNTTGAALGATTLVQARIVQGQAARQGGTTLCGGVTQPLPSGGCTFTGNVVASNAAGGVGTLVPGPATAIFSLVNQDLAGNLVVIDFKSVAVTLQ